MLVITRTWYCEQIPSRTIPTVVPVQNCFISRYFLLSSAILSHHILSRLMMYAPWYAVPIIRRRRRRSWCPSSTRVWATSTRRPRCWEIYREARMSPLSQVWCDDYHDHILDGVFWYGIFDATSMTLPGKCYDKITRSSTQFWMGTLTAVLPSSFLVHLVQSLTW